MIYFFLKFNELLITCLTIGGVLTLLILYATILIESPWKITNSYQRNFMLLFFGNKLSAVISTKILSAFIFCTCIYVCWCFLDVLKYIFMIDNLIQESNLIKVENLDKLKQFKEIKSQILIPEKLPTSDDLFAPFYLFLIGVSVFYFINSCVI